MKTLIPMKHALYVAVLVVLGLFGCEGGLEIYSIDAPADLQARIDSIAAAKAGVDTGDTTYIDIATRIVGPEDNSAAWWAHFSDYFTIPTNKLLRLEFINNGTGVNNWNNWNLAVTTAAERDGEGYAEFFVLRSDAFGWGNEDFDLGLVSQNYPDTDGNGDIWNDFRTTMQGAYVTLDIDHSPTGNVFVTATAVGTNGTELVQTYQQPVGTLANIGAFLICDGSHFEMKKAYLLPSRVTVVEDVQPVSLTIQGAPASVEIGNENFWGDAVATVTFADGSSTEVDSADLSFNVVPDMTTVGEKTVIVAYSKTKQGAFTQAVSTFYKLQVTNPISSIEATNVNYYYFSSDNITFNPRGIVVTAIYADGSEAVLENSALDFDYPASVSPSVGTQAVNITYVGPANTFTTTSTVTFVQGINQVGASDFSTPWWTQFSDEYAVASGASTKIKMYSYSNGLNNWHSPCVILRRGDLSEFAVVRMDNFGWGPGYGVATATNNWSWDVFASSIHGSYIEVTVTNNGDGTANIRYDVTYATGETRFQEYAGVAVDSADLNAAIVLEGSYVVIVE